MAANRQVVLKTGTAIRWNYKKNIVHTILGSEIWCKLSKGKCFRCNFKNYYILSWVLVFMMPAITVYRSKSKVDQQSLVVKSWIVSPCTLPFVFNITTYIHEGVASARHHLSSVTDGCLTLESFPLYTSVTRIHVNGWSVVHFVWVLSCGLHFMPPTVYNSYMVPRYGMYRTL